MTAEPTFVGVDLSSRFSAVAAVQSAGRATLLYSNVGDVFKQGLRGQTNMIVAGCRHAQCVLIEDVPPSLPNTKVMKQQYLAQGALLYALHSTPVRDRVYTIIPQHWQKFFDIHGGKSRDIKARARVLASELGCEMPYWVHELHYAADRNKATEDICDAFLIAEFARLNWDEEALTLSDKLAVRYEY